jgi:hypothetical protein
MTTDADEIRSKFFCQTEEEMVCMMSLLFRLSSQFALSLSDPEKQSDRKSWLNRVCKTTKESYEPHLQQTIALLTFSRCPINWIDFAGQAH